MTAQRVPFRTRPTGARIRVGLWGRIGSGNYGNDGTFEAVVNSLRSRLPEAELDCLCTGPDVISGRYNMPTSQLHWDRGGHRLGGGVPGKALRIAVGVFVDGWRTGRWVRGHSVVIVPGMGALESSLPLRPWQTPWALFAVALAGRIHAVPVIFLSVGATPISERLSRWLIVTATRMSSLSTFRDQYSRDAMAKMGAGTSHDLVVPDMAFSLEAPVAHREVVDQVVGVGVMAWHGSNDDRRRSAMIHEEYVATMRQFLTWLLQSGYHVRLFTGDHDDNGVACRLRSEVLAQAAAVEESHVVFEPVSSLSELMSQMSGLYAVVGARYHNVVGALRCAVPTIATGYSEKHRALMESFGQGRFCVDVRNLDLDRLTTTFLSLEREREAVRAHLDTAAKEAGQRVRRQFDELALALGQPNQQLARAWRS